MCVWFSGAFIQSFWRKSSWNLPLLACLWAKRRKGPSVLMILTKHLEMCILPWCEQGKSSDFVGVVVISARRSGGESKERDVATIHLKFCSTMYTSIYSHKTFWLDTAEHLFRGGVLTLPSKILIRPFTKERTCWDCTSRLKMTFLYCISVTNDNSRKCFCSCRMLKLSEQRIVPPNYLPYTIHEYANNVHSCTHSFI